MPLFNLTDEHFTRLPPEQAAIRTKFFRPREAGAFNNEDREQSIPALFEKIVRMYPDRIAVKTTTHALTYEELNRAANRLARTILMRQGHAAEPVGVLLDDGDSTAVAMLGISKVGRISIHLDPGLPLDRLDFSVKDTHLDLLLTDNENYPLATELFDKRLPILNVEALDPNSTAENLNLTIDPASAAEIVYTSGSTGQPKGVVCSHRFIIHKYASRFADPILSATDVRVTGLGLLQRASLYRALLTGIAVLPWSIRKAGLDRLRTWLRDERISVLQCAPSIFRHFALNLTGEDNFPYLHVLNLTGEPVMQADVELFKNHFSAQCVLSCVLGTTETGIFREYLIDKQIEVPNNAVPAGYEVSGVHSFLTDEDNRQLEIGSIGEIAVKSRYLATGYWQRPDLTEAAFRPAPDGGSEQIYLTGDFGRLSADGCLEYMGRKDDQVKVRGMKVHLGQIERALLAHKGVTQAAVVLRQVSMQQQQLVAYFVRAKDSRLTTGDLRAFLAPALPDYMIPSAFVVLASLPLRPNGKIDRNALPEPDNSRPELHTPFVAPRTPLEEDVAQIWSEVLRLDQVGVHDNFLELGGHSLAASQVISRVVNTFQLDLAVQSLFQSPTVAEMSSLIAKSQAKKSSEEDLARTLAELELLSEDEAEVLMARGSPEK